MENESLYSQQVRRLQDHGFARFWAKILASIWLDGYHNGQLTRARKSILIVGRRRFGEPTSDLSELLGQIVDQNRLPRMLLVTVDATDRATVAATE